MPTIWLWEQATFSPLVMPHFKPVEVKKLSIDQIMFATRMASSVADAQRLVKAGGVTFRHAGACVTQDQEHKTCVCDPQTPKPVKECKHVLRKFKDPRETLPEGWPIIIHCGSMGHPRMTKRVDGKQGFDTWVGAITVMIPTEGQTIEFWSDEWCFTKQEIEDRLAKRTEQGWTGNFITAVTGLEWERQHEPEFVWIDDVPTVTVSLEDVSDDSMLIVP